MDKISLKGQDFESKINANQQRQISDSFPDNKPVNAGSSHKRKDHKFIVDWQLP